MSKRLGQIDSEDFAREDADRHLTGFYLRFAFGSMRRHWVLAMAVFTAVVSLAFGIIRALPRSYHVETKLMARRQQSLPLVARPGLGEEAPTAGAWETIHGHDNLMAIARKLGPAGTSAAERFPFNSTNTQEVTDEERLESLVKALDNRVTVTTAEGTVTISVDWSTAAGAVSIVTLAAEKFFAARRAAEIEPIEEAISILEGRAVILRNDLEALQAAVLRLRRASTPAAGRAGTGLSRTAREAGKLEANIKAKRQAIAELEETRRRKLAELRAQFTQDQSLYGASYPSLLDLQGRIEALTQPSPQVAPLREEERALVAEYGHRFGELPADSSRDPAGLGGRDGPEMENTPDSGEARLRRATLDYQSLLERINATRIELETARAAFKYRYGVLWPVETPSSPDRPKTAKLLGLAIAFALFCAGLATVARDLSSHMLLNREQVERALGVQVLGQVRTR
jgi:uncharacterized protein involved in exopolysaccharide biosynthesis